MEKDSAKDIVIGFTKSEPTEEQEIMNNESNPPLEGNEQDAKPKRGRAAKVLNEIKKSIANSDEVDIDSDDLNREYTDICSVTINLVKNYSLYRKANDKVLPKRKDYIGSSIIASRTLTSNKDEIDAYLPNLIGISPSDPSYINRVKQYFNNIRIPVDELGRSFDISFYYKTKRDYIRVKKQLDEIETAYQSANKQDISRLRAALKEKITKINIVESTKWKLGHPVNVDDYLMYRHCLLYNDVAKDLALINVDSNIRFYFKDNKKEADKLKRYRQEITTAKTNYVNCIADNELFDAVYIQYCVYNNLPVIASLAEDKVEREIKLDKFSTEDPIRFNKIVANKDNKLIAFIEKLIARGELIRSQYNQNITSPDGDFIGANMTEAIAWFKNKDNTSMINVLKNKLNNI